MYKINKKLTYASAILFRFLKFTSKITKSAKLLRSKLKQVKNHVLKTFYTKNNNYYHFMQW